MVGHIYDPNTDSHGGVSSDFLHSHNDIVLQPTIPTTTTTATTISDKMLSPLEVWCLIRIEQWYQQALSRKCPFLRRRMSDFLDALEMLVRIMLIRQERMDLVGPPVGCRGDERTRHKTRHLTLQELEAIIRKDWKEDTSKGYYVTGRLTPAIYRDDCFFDGPDPDMPVRGLRKVRLDG